MFGRTRRCSPFSQHFFLQNFCLLEGPCLWELRLLQLKSWRYARSHSRLIVHKGLAVLESHNSYMWAPFCKYICFKHQFRSLQVLSIVVSNPRNEWPDICLKFDWFFSLEWDLFGQCALYITQRPGAPKSLKRYTLNLLVKDLWCISTLELPVWGKWRFSHFEVYRSLTVCCGSSAYCVLSFLRRWEWLRPDW